MARNNNKRKKKQRSYVLIVCEGETEKNYITKVIQPHLRATGHNVRIKCKKFDKIPSIVGFLTRPEQPCDAVFLVSDLDECTTDSDKIESYCEREKNLFNEPKLKKIQKGSFYSYPSFEYWYLLHCKKDCAPKTGTSKQVEDELKKHLSNYTKPMPRTKQEGKFFSERIDVAINNEAALRANEPGQLPFAAQLRPHAPQTVTNPMSEMGKLIEALKSVKPVD